MITKSNSLFLVIMIFIAGAAIWAVPVRSADLIGVDEKTTMTPTQTPTPEPTPIIIENSVHIKLVEDKLGIKWNAEKELWIYDGKEYITEELNSIMPGFESFYPVREYKAEYIDRSLYIDAKTLEVKSK